MEDRSCIRTVPDGDIRHKDGCSKMIPREVGICRADGRKGGGSDEMDSGTMVALRRVRDMSQVCVITILTTSVLGYLGNTSIRGASLDHRILWKRLEDSAMDAMVYTVTPPTIKLAIRRISSPKQHSSTDYHLGLEISTVFVILIASFIGAWFPPFANRGDGARKLGILVTLQQCAFWTISLHHACTLARSPTIPFSDYSTLKAGYASHLDVLVEGNMSSLIKVHSSILLS
ncbi:hypothetical protein CC78DRAFT_587673 [Lojkania enalia]|uniref:Uncharacterized protein n=1 Tax=Lojkania enalia TaxID=147567 RepID=A0A9P4MXY2_9PLEO|nr:hypothetical protein CC78DRAFT_587673 [Didymosphaeria enalia]